MIQSVVLDFDGTIIDSKTAGVRIFRQLAEEFGQPLSPAHAALLPGMWGTHWKDLLSRLLPSLEPSAFMARWLELERERPAQYPPYPGARIAIETLRHRGHFLVLHTNRGWTEALGERLVEAAISRYWFDLIVTSDEAPPKPAPRALKAVLERLGEAYGVEDNPAAVCVVSDTAGDAEMTLACGCQFIGVLTGAATPEDFAAFGRRIMVVRSIADVPRALEERFGPPRHRTPRRRT